MQNSGSGFIGQVLGDRNQIEKQLGQKTVDARLGRSSDRNARRLVELSEWLNLPVSK